MPVVTIDETAVRNVIAILQRGTYKELTYENIHSIRPYFPIKIGNKTIRIMPSIGDPSFSVFCNIQIDESSEQVTPENSWKFQISIRDYVTTENPTGKANLIRAWNRVKEILLFHGVVSCKVVKSKAKADDKRKDYEKGKQITIYVAMSLGLNWNEILRDITIALRLFPPILHGDKPSNCQRIDDFISYRNDFNPESTNKSTDKSANKSTNTGNTYTPLSDEMSLEVAAQYHTDAYNPYKYADCFAETKFDITPDAQRLLEMPSQIDQLLQYVKAPSTSSSSTASSSTASSTKDEEFCGIMNTKS